MNQKPRKETEVPIAIYRVGRRCQDTVTANFALRIGELDETKTVAIDKALSEASPA